MVPELSLAIQYGVDAPELPRWRIRRWVAGAIAAAQETAPHKLELTLRLVDKAEALELNRTYRHKDYAPNGLTFTYDEPATDQSRMADIVICSDVMAQEAMEQGKPFLDHACHLIVHGCLHALGYDHLRVSQARIMESLEIQVLARFGIANPYESKA